MNTLIKKLIFLALMAVLTACGKQYQDPAVAKYVDSFVQDAANHGKNLQINNEIEFGDAKKACDQDHAVGCCVHDNVDNLLNGKIILDKAYWDLVSELDQKMVVYHELAHCALGKGHNPALENWTVEIPTKSKPGEVGPDTTEIDYVLPGSIMNPSVPTDAMIKAGGDAYYSHLLDDLFN